MGYKVGIYGDLHLSSKNYGAHRDYPKETLEYLAKITDITRENGLTHLIGLGDFSFGRFHSLEYRLEVEKQLREQNILVGGNRYELMGNHDKAGYGLVERDYYIANGYLRQPENLTLKVLNKSLNITMVNYGEIGDTEVNINDSEDDINVVLSHDFLKFNDTRLPNFGDAIILDNMEKWFGADIIICGHVHKIMEFEGYIVKGENNVHKAMVMYPGCMARPAYREGHTDLKGQIIILDFRDNGELHIEKEEFDLWSLEDAFNLEMKQEEQEKIALKESRVDISDIVKQLDSHDRNVGNPEDIISGMLNIDARYKNKAINLLKDALA